MSLAQTGINTLDAKINLHVKSEPTNVSIVDGMIAPVLTGDQLKNKNDLYDQNQMGAFVYVSSVPTSFTTKTSLVIHEGYYYFDGEMWRTFQDDLELEDDAKRFLGGTVYVRFQSQSVTDGSIFDDVIQGGSYQIGTANATATRGGIVSIRGDGFKISNPRAGIFDIEFDTPFVTIYGISTNIIDAYGVGSEASTVTGKYPDIGAPGNTLKTTDNTQVSFISNTIIRVKTGDQYGNDSNRSFTFLVSGQ